MAWFVQWFFLLPRFGFPRFSPVFSLKVQNLIYRRCTLITNYRARRTILLRSVLSLSYLGLLGIGVRLV